MSDPQDQGVRDVPELAGWWPEQQPDNTNTRCRHGCCPGPYCRITYIKHGPEAAIAEAYAPRKQTLLGRLRGLFTRKTQSKGKP